jgi:hypothetical protein
MPIVVTFADSRMRSALTRVKRQAKKFSEFETTYAWSESALDPSFVSGMGAKLSRDVRGFGYWSWKPQVILQALDKMNDGEILVYMDAGCHLNLAGAARLGEYFDIVAHSTSGILGFQLESNAVGLLHESTWTKGDVLDFFDVRNNILVTESDQICGTIIVLQKRVETIVFFEKWRDLFVSNFSLFDDSASLSANAPNFIEHRHDQSVFSIMAKLAGVSVVSHSENYPLSKLPSGKLNWQSLDSYPIHARRDKGFFLRKMAGRLARPLRSFLKKSI